MNTQTFRYSPFAAILLGLLLQACTEPTDPNQPNGREPVSDAMISTFATVCRDHRGVTGAGSYDSIKPRTQNVVALSENGSRNALTDYIPTSMIPTSVAATNVIACISPDEKKSLNECGYGFLGIVATDFVFRYQHYVEVTYREASTGRFLKSSGLYGSSPECPDKMPSQKSLTGTEVQGEALYNQLNSYGI